MKITNPDVYKGYTSGMYACLVSIEHEMDRTKGISAEEYEELRALYDNLLAFQDRFVNGKRPGF